MQENEIYNAKKELANLYLILKNDSEEVIIILILYLILSRKNQMSIKMN
jgi:hypothetical protein